MPISQKHQNAYSNNMLAQNAPLAREMFQTTVAQRQTLDSEYPSQKQLSHHKSSKKKKLGPSSSKLKKDQAHTTEFLITNSVQAYNKNHS